ncbi:MAG: VCBS repeat-containing protein [Planctomycetes bacterium]|nr:VCBS repeat-containing protein [Planctomycetota bacterium]
MATRTSESLRGARRLAPASVFAALAISRAVSGDSCDPAFTPRTVFDVGMNVGVSAVLDLDGDGHLDLTTGTAIFLGDGRGGLGPDAIPLGPESYLTFDVAFDDFDGDGRLDTAICTKGEDSVLILHGRPEAGPGRPVFGDILSVPTIPAIWHLALADFLEDGRPDIVAVSAGFPEVSLLTNLGNRRFRSETHGPLASGGHPLAAGDFDGDGHADIAVGEMSEVTFLFGKGDGMFRPPVFSAILVSGSTVPIHRFRAADLDGDGRSDLLAIGGNYAVVYLGCEIDPIEGLPRTPSAALPVIGAGRFIAMADMNGDGALDVVAQSASSQGKAVVQVFRADPDAAGPFTLLAGTAVTTGLPGSAAVLAVGDMDEDGAPDIVLTTEGGDGLGQVFLNTGACFVRRAERGDANADGRRDLADPIAVLGHVISSGPLACPEAAEVNGDGRLDLADPIYLLSYLFASGSAPQGPTPVICRSKT